MGLEHFKSHLNLPNEDVTSITRRVLGLFRCALPDPDDRVSFDRFMAEAHNANLSWIESLEYVVEQRYFRAA